MKVTQQRGRGRGGKGSDSEEQEIRWRGNVAIIRMMMIDENDDVNGANGIGVFGECRDFGVTENGMRREMRIATVFMSCCWGILKQFEYQ